VQQRRERGPECCYQVLSLVKGGKSNPLKDVRSTKRTEWFTSTKKKGEYGKKERKNGERTSVSGVQMGLVAIWNHNHVREGVKRFEVENTLGEVIRLIAVGRFTLCRGSKLATTKGGGGGDLMDRLTLRYSSRILK